MDIWDHSICDLIRSASETLKQDNNEKSKMVDYKKLSYLEILPMLYNFFLKKGEIRNAKSQK